MSKRYVAPDPAAISKLLGIIFGEDIVVSENSSADLSNKHIATFIDREDELVALCACDKPCVGYSGGALSMIPVGAVEDMLADGEISEALQGNFYEVMNICSKLMMSDSSDHLRLDKTMTDDAISDDIVALSESASTHVGFTLDIPQYGKGTIDFFIA